MSVRARRRRRVAVHSREFGGHFVDEFFSSLFQLPSRITAHLRIRAGLVRTGKKKEKEKISIVTNFHDSFAYQMAVAAAAAVDAASSSSSSSFFLFFFLILRSERCRDSGTKLRTCSRDRLSLPL